jgi:hypothetical protein
VDANTVAVVGILGTLAAGLLGPWIGGKAQRSALREDRLLDSKLVAYSDLLETARQYRDDAHLYAAVPSLDLKPPDPDRLRANAAQVRVVGSDKIVALADEVAALMNNYWRGLFDAIEAKQRAQREGHADTDEAIRARLALADIAQAITEVVKELEAAIRAEMKV